MIDVITVGDTVDFETTVNDYPASDGWTLKYRLVPRVSGSGVAVTLTAATATNGTDYLVQVAPATTAAWIAAEYSWNSWVEKSGARYVVESGLVTLKPDPSTITSGDNRSHARIMLDAIQAVMQNRASNTQLEYSIGDRMLKFIPPKELREHEAYYQAIVAKEDNQARIAAGLSSRAKVQVRL